MCFIVFRFMCANILFCLNKFLSLRQENYVCEACVCLPQKKGITHGLIKFTICMKMTPSMNFATTNRGRNYYIIKYCRRSRCHRFGSQFSKPKGSIYKQTPCRKNKTIGSNLL